VRPFHSNDFTMRLGIDIGSVTAKAVVIDEANSLVASEYLRTRGQPVETILAILRDLFQRYPPGTFQLAATTGTGGKLVAEILGIPFVNEIIAQAAGTGLYHPEVKTIIEIGGEDSKLIQLNRESPDKPPVVAEFTMNSACAAGTGSFLDQQASRMGLPIERFGDAAMRSEHPPRIAGRCSVFAKSDMIHLQQVGAPVVDIAAGLCFAMVRNFKGNVVGGSELEKPVSFQGGVAANRGIRRAILEVLQLAPEELIIPEHFALLGALGAVLKTGGKTRDKADALPADTLQRLEAYISRREYRFLSLPPLRGDDYKIDTEPVKTARGERIDAYVGVDIGSISTNVVVIDENNNIIARRYLMTASQPIEAVKRGL